METLQRFILPPRTPERDFFSIFHPVFGGTPLRNEEHSPIYFVKKNIASKKFHPSRNQESILKKQIQKTRTEQEKAILNGNGFYL